MIDTNIIYEYEPVLSELPKEEQDEILSEGKIKSLGEIIGQPDENDLL